MLEEEESTTMNASQCDGKQTSLEMPPDPQRQEAMGKGSLKDKHELREGSVFISSLISYRREWRPGQSGPRSACTCSWWRPSLCSLNRLHCGWTLQLLREKKKNKRTLVIAKLANCHSGSETKVFPERTCWLEDVWIWKLVEVRGVVDAFDLDWNGGGSLPVKITALVFRPSSI